MAGDERRYDFGLRGYPQATTPLVRRPRRRMRFDPFSAEWYAAPRREVPRSPRVTQRYNREYVDDRYNERRSDGWSEARFDRLAREGEYGPPYRTVGGTTTGRGVFRPGRPAPGGYGSGYGGRYLDEM